MDDEEAYGSSKQPGREEGGEAEMALDAAGVEEDIHVSDEEGD